jgi:hypothetical protein
MWYYALSSFMVGFKVVLSFGMAALKDSGTIK